MPDSALSPASSTPEVPKRFRVLFVCMGNICRSPTAHGVFEHLVAQAGLTRQVEVDSAGTHSYHVGAPPDGRSQEHALKRGHDLSKQRARQLVRSDFTEFDLVLTMDHDNQARALALCPPDQVHKVRRFAEFFQQYTSPVVPDPYKGGSHGFEHVLDLVEDGCEGLLQHVRQQLPAQGS